MLRRPRAYLSNRALVFGRALRWRRLPSARLSFAWRAFLLGRAQQLSVRSAVSGTGDLTLETQLARPGAS